MLHRRDFLTRTLQGSTLLALGSVVPGFVADTARAAEKDKDNILVLLELSGGNDGLNTVIPYTNDDYHKARPTLGFKKLQVVRVDDEIGLHPALRTLDRFIQAGQLAIVQGVGYPNPDRSHFESMDIWQSADPRRKTTSGWIGRSGTLLQKDGNVPILHIGANRLPLALQGTSGTAVSINSSEPYKLELGTSDAGEVKKRQALLAALAEPGKGDDRSMLSFVQRRQLQTYTTVDRIKQALQTSGGNNPGFFYGPDGPYGQNSLVQKLQLVARLVQQGFGTRVFYAMIDGFDTHSGQAEEHRKLLQQLADAISNMYQTLQGTGDDKRVVTMTFSEFGRRVVENGSRGTDHGSGSSLFVVGPGIKGGLVGKHPSLTDLDSGDLRWHTDFRRVYATILDRWLHCDSKTVLDGTFEHFDFVKKA